MNQTTELLHRIADSTLSYSERARVRCQLAKQLEEAGNYEAAREAMSELWRGVGHSPVIQDLDKAAAGDVLLRAGVLTGWIGSCKQIEGAQEVAKNLISESIRSFERIQDIEKIAEAETDLAICYWREGTYDNARVLLNGALSRLTDKDSEIKILALLRSAIVEKSSGNYDAAFRIHTEAAPLVEVSNNYVLRGKFHNSFANVLENLGIAKEREDYIDRALIEYTAASIHFAQAGNSRYQARVENNLGFLFGKINKFREAHGHLDRAQALFTSLKDKSHIAQVDDTRAGVLLAEGRISEAEKLARLAVSTLETGGQNSLLAEALTTHGIALARMGNHPSARRALQRAVEVAEDAGDSESAGHAALTFIEELGEYCTDEELGAIWEHAVELLSISQQPSNKDRLLSCARRVLFLVSAIPSPTFWKGFSLERAVRRYEGRIIERALRDAKGSVTRAARLLGLKHHGTLVNKLNRSHKHLLSNRSPVVPRRFSLMFIDESEKETRPVSILHVEDNQMVADTLKATLEMEGWTVETLMDGAAALEALQSETHFDVLIIDYELPGINGLELVTQARRLTHRQLKNAA